MLLYRHPEDQSLSSAHFDHADTGRQRSAAGPKGAPPAIPPIIINPYQYQVPGAARRSVLKFSPLAGMPSR